MSADIESDYSKQINPVSPSVLVPPSYQHDDRRRHQSPQQGQLQCTYNQHDDEADQIGRRNQRRRRSLFRSVPAAPQVNNWLRNAKSATLSAKSAAPRRHTMESVMPNAGPASQQRAAKQAPDGKGKQQQPHQQAGTAETASPRQSKVAVGTGKQQQRWNQNPAPDIQQVISTDVHKQLKIQAALQARERFQHAIKLVITLVRVFNMIQSRTEKEAQSRDYMTFTEIAEQFQSEDMKNSGLSFNPKDFKANREINISIEVKNILSMPSDQRTPEQLQTALYGLQTMKSFAEYPLHMQEKLTRVAWLEHIPPKKIIIRQGHYAEAFYFVISGSAVVTIMETNPNTGETKMRTATVLRKGSSFGELALLHHSVRTATVSSQGQVQLLAIGREDFFDIFMRGQRPGEEPEHITFLRQIDCLKDFPFEKLKEHPEKCLFHFYKRGQVIVKDSNNSEWLYIVKSGTCQVLKQLRAVKPTELRQRGFKLPRIDDSNGGVSGMRHANLLMALAESPRTPRETQTDNRRDSLLSERSNQDEARDELMPLPRSTFLTRSRTADSSSSSSTSLSQATSATASTSSSGSSSSGSSSSPSPTSSDVDIRKGAVLTKRSYSRSKYHTFPSTKRAHFQPPKAQQNSPSSNKENYAKSSGSSQKTERKERSVFVQLELLHPKSVFGLNTLHFDDDLLDGQQTSVYLISRAAECILLHKAFFLKHVNDKVRREVRKVNRPYPTTETLQEHLQDFTNWNHFKKETISHVVDDR